MRLLLICLTFATMTMEASPFAQPSPIQERAMLYEKKFESFDFSAWIYRDETPVAKHLKTIDISETGSNLSFVDCIYVINLDERPEKWERTKALFSQAGLRVNRVAAINGWKLSEETKKELFGCYPIRLRGGEIGCLLSHISVLKDAYERGFHVIWICEDDIKFNEDVHQIPDLLLKLDGINPDWDVFYTDIDSRNDEGEYMPSLGSDFRPEHNYPPIFFYIRRSIIENDIMKIGQRFGTHSYLVSRKGIKKFIDFFTHVYLWAPLDVDMHYTPGIQQYSATRDIVSGGAQYVSDTSTAP